MCFGAELYLETVVLGELFEEKGQLFSLGGVFLDFTGNAHVVHQQGVRDNAGVFDELVESPGKALAIFPVGDVGQAVIAIGEYEDSEINPAVGAIDVQEPPSPIELHDFPRQVVDVIKAFFPLVVFQSVEFLKFGVKS